MIIEMRKGKKQWYKGNIMNYVFMCFTCASPSRCTDTNLALSIIVTVYQTYLPWARLLSSNPGQLGRKLKFFQIDSVVQCEVRILASAILRSTFDLGIFICLMTVSINLFHVIALKYVRNKFTHDICPT